VGEKVETRSEKARHVILKYENMLYHVDTVNVDFSEAKQMYNAVFRAKRLNDNRSFDLGFDITQKLYDVLVEYTKLGNSDLLLVLEAEDEEFKWSFLSENWLHQQEINSKVSRYVI
jgi:hypothetical protein